MIMVVPEFWICESPISERIYVYAGPMGSDVAYNINLCYGRWCDVPMDTDSPPLSDEEYPHPILPDHHETDALFRSIGREITVEDPFLTGLIAGGRIWWPLKQCSPYDELPTCPYEIDFERSVTMLERLGWFWADEKQRELSMPALSLAYMMSHNVPLWISICRSVDPTMSSRRRYWLRAAWLVPDIGRTDMQDYLDNFRHNIENAYFKLALPTLSLRQITLGDGHDFVWRDPISRVSVAMYF